MAETSAILLAAGLSRRMGPTNKLLLPVGGKPLVRHVVDTYCSAIAGEVLVVLGHEHEKVAAALEGAAVRTVLNAAYAEGQPTSVMCGLQSAPVADDVVIGLCDQPFLSASDILSLISAHRDAVPGKISIPLHNGLRGNPIVVPAAVRPQLLADAKHPGCHRFTRAHPDRVQYLPLVAPGFYTDMDTPESYKAHFPDDALEMVL